MTEQSAVPHYNLDDAQSLVKEHFGVRCQVKPLPSYIDLNFLTTTEDGIQYILKIANANEPKIELEMQNAVMDFLANNPVDDMSFPEVMPSKNGSKIVELEHNNSIYYMRLLSFVPGTFYVDVEAHDAQLRSSLAKALAQLNCQLEDFNHPAAGRYLIWDLKQASNVIRKYKDAISSNDTEAINSILALFETQVLPIADDLPKQVIHNDANDYNVLTSNGVVCGLIDFGDMVESWRVNELAIAATYAILDQDQPVAIMAEMAATYHQFNALTEAEINAFFYLVLARLGVSVCNSAYAYKQTPDNEYLLVSSKPAWRAIKQLLSVDHVACAMQIKAKCGLLKNASNQEAIKAFRDVHLSKSLSLSYQDPLKIVQGSGVYLYDEKGNAYLDMVNNVCHVGHCHPKVVAAGQQQMARLNTNTRYLHDNIVNYSRALLETFPKPLSVVFLVNSGSEANELAMRLVKAHTGSDEMIVVEGAYHGHTNKTIEISPYKFNGKGGEGKADNIHVVPMPDPFRGEYKGHSETSGKSYASYVAEHAQTIVHQNKKLGGFICESLQGVGGNLVMPDGYLSNAYQAVRAAGGLCIADEVQVGFGRVGSHWWGFETQNVVPDIVTIGKPIGNGHPMAAVITTQEVAESFVTGMEYFNTYGGNPVSSAIGLAVLETIKSEKLKENAEQTGEYFKEKLLALSKKYHVIGDVRGLGLFLGVELVKNRDTLEPAVDVAKACIEELKQRGILLSLDGPYGNVFKIKPPIVFNKSHVDFFIEQLTDVFDVLSVN